MKKRIKNSLNMYMVEFETWQHEYSERGGYRASEYMHDALEHIAEMIYLLTGYEYDAYEQSEEMFQKAEELLSE